MNTSNLISPGTTLALMQASQETQASGKKVKDLQEIIDTKEFKKFEDAAQEFEAVFTGEMLKPMFENIDSGGPFGGGKGEEVFRGMLVQEYGKILARTGSIGMTTQIRDQMIKMQEEANNAAQVQAKA